METARQFRQADVHVQVADARVLTAVSVPEGEGPFPAVLVLHEAFGLNEDIRAIADEFAAHGYLAAAPDLVEGGRIPCLIAAIRDMARGRGPMIERARGLAAWVGERDDVVSGRVGAAGFCLGGAYALLLGSFGDVAAVSDAYGRVPDDETIATLCPTVAHYGGSDRLLPGSYPRRLRKGLEDAGVAHDVKVYPDAGHSFMNQHTPPAFFRGIAPLVGLGHRPGEAADAWERVFEFFATHLGDDAA